MSSTVTTSHLNLVLEDYALHRSQPASSPVDVSRLQASSTPQPADWPTDYRRVPPHRPVEHLDLSERVVFQSGFERFFITTMFFGIRVVTVFHRTWAATGGKINDRIFRYELGSEH